MRDGLRDRARLDSTLAGFRWGEISPSVYRNFVRILKRCWQVVWLAVMCRSGAGAGSVALAWGRMAHSQLAGSTSCPSTQTMKCR